MNELQTPVSAACLTEFQLDKYVAGELVGAAHAQATHHLEGCHTCQVTLASLKTAQSEFALRPAALPFASAKRRSAWSPTRRWQIAGGATALAAAMALYVGRRGGGELGREAVIAPETTKVRAKGAARVDAFIKGASGTRRARSGDVVAAGDVLQFVWSSERPGFAALFGRDGTQRLAQYAPAEDAATPTRADGMLAMPAGGDVPLPLSLELDGVPGRETYYAIMCDRATPVAALREVLATAPATRAWPEGCHLDEWSFEKR